MRPKELEESRPLNRELGEQLERETGGQPSPFSQLLKGDPEAEAVAKLVFPEAEQAWPGA